MNTNDSALVKNYEYIEWILMFSKENEAFTEASWVYREISKDDKERVSRIECFYREICDYAKRKGISPCISSEGTYHAIAYKGNCILVGRVHSDGGKAFVSLITSCKQETISFEEIVNEHNEREKAKQDMLINYEAMTEDAIRGGIPKDTLIKLITQCYSLKKV